MAMCENNNEISNWVLEMLKEDICKAKSGQIEFLGFLINSQTQIKSYLEKVDLLRVYILE